MGIVQWNVFDKWRCRSFAKGSRSFPVFVCSGDFLLDLPMRIEAETILERFDIL